MALFPEYLEFKRHKRMLLAVTESNPYFRVDQGDDTPDVRRAAASPTSTAAR